MRILIACDRSTSVKNLFHDFKRAGLPGRGVKVLALSVADVLTPPKWGGRRLSDFRSSREPEYFEDLYREVDREIETAEIIARGVASGLGRKFPRWKFRSEGLGDSPAWGILRKAKAWKADLVVLGSHGWTRMGEIFSGSVAQKVLSEALCSVRIVRARETKAALRPRVVIAVDGSKESLLAVAAVAGRSWKKGTPVHLVTAVDSSLSSAVMAPGFVVSKWLRPSDKEPRDWIRRVHRACAKQLEKAHLVISSLIKKGDPKQVLLKEAKSWGADAIFVGARGHRLVEQIVLGSVSAALAARAHCSVEVIRSNRL